MAAFTQLPLQAAAQPACTHKATCVHFSQDTNHSKRTFFSSRSRPRIWFLSDTGFFFLALPPAFLCTPPPARGWLACRERAENFLAAPLRGELRQACLLNCS